MNHFTNKVGYDAIRSQATWRFLAAQPPGGHPRGAYFTTLGPQEKKLANKLRIPREKIAYLFAFTGDVGLFPLTGGRGAYVYYSPGDYEVSGDRQRAHSETGLL